MLTEAERRALAAAMLTADSATVAAVLKLAC
jgi:hypothetical protein